MPAKKRKGGSPSNTALLQVLGKGDDGCVLSGRVKADCRAFEETLPVNGMEYVNDTITKVTVKKHVFEKEWAFAHKLHSIDPKQEHLLYPFKACESSIPLDARTYDACNLDPSRASSTLYLLQMRHGGRSLRQLAANKVKLPPAETTKIIEDVRAALRVLHRNGLVHGDVHDGNIMVDMDDSNMHVRKAYLIDFGYAKDLTTDRQLEDVKDFVKRIVFKTASAITAGGSYISRNFAGDVIKYPSFQRIDDVHYEFSPSQTPVRSPQATTTTTPQSAMATTSSIRAPRRGRLAFEDDASSPSSPTSPIRRINF